MPEAIYTARPLTDEEKIFAEKNHNLMYRYIRIHELDLEDWYDILIIPYLQAVKKYFTYEHLQKYKFEQIFFRTLDSARSNYWRAMNRKMRCPSGGIYSYENLVCKRERDDLTGLECAENMAYLANGICNESAENEVVGTEMLKEALKTLDAEEQMIIKKKLYGYSDEEIPYLQAVKKYFSYLDLREYKFEKICFRILDSARKNHWIKAERRKCYPSGKYFYYPTQTTTEDEALALGMLKVAVESLTDTQREILLSLVNGSRSSDVIEKLCISSATYYRQVRTIKQIIRGEKKDV